MCGRQAFGRDGDGDAASVAQVQSGADERDGRGGADAARGRRDGADGRAVGQADVGRIVPAAPPTQPDEHAVARRHRAQPLTHAHPQPPARRGPDPQGRNGGQKPALVASRAGPRALQLG